MIHWKMSLNPFVNYAEEQQSQPLSGIGAMVYGTSGPHGPPALVIHMTLLYNISTHLCLTTVNMRKNQQMLLARCHLPSLWWCHLSVKQTLLHCRRAMVPRCLVFRSSLYFSLMLNSGIACIFLWLYFVLQLENRDWRCNSLIRRKHYNTSKLKQQYPAI